MKFVQLLAAGIIFTSTSSGCSTATWVYSRHSDGFEVRTIPVAVPLLSQNLGALVSRYLPFAQGLDLCMAAPT